MINKLEEIGINVEEMEKKISDSEIEKDVDKYIRMMEYSDKYKIYGGFLN